MDGPIRTYPDSQINGPTIYGGYRCPDISPGPVDNPPRSIFLCLRRRPSRPTRARRRSSSSSAGSASSRRRWRRRRTPATTVAIANHHTGAGNGSLRTASCAGAGPRVHAHDRGHLHRPPGVPPAPGDDAELRPAGAATPTTRRSGRSAGTSSPARTSTAGATSGCWTQTPCSRSTPTPSTRPWTRTSPRASAICPCTRWPSTRTSRTSRISPTTPAGCA